MKHFKLHRGELAGVAPGSIPTRSRLDSLSLVSRQSVLGILLVFLTLFSGSVWGETETLTESEIKANFTSSTHAYSSGAKSYTDGSVVWYMADFSTDANNRPWMQIKKDAGVYLKITTPTSSSITNVTLTITSASNSSGGVADITKHTAFSGRVALLTADATGSTTMTGVAYADGTTNNSVSLNPTGTNNELFVKVSAGARLWGASVTYTIASKESGVCQEPAQWPG